MTSLTYAQLHRQLANERRLLRDALARVLEAEETAARYRRLAMHLADELHGRRVAMETADDARRLA